MALVIGTHFSQELPVKTSSHRDSECVCARASERVFAQLSFLQMVVSASVRKLFRASVKPLTIGRQKGTHVYGPL